MEALLYKATTLPDAWFQLVYALMKGDTPRNVYEIESGSYVGQKRLEFPYVTVQIDHPGSRPLIPDIPAGLGIPAPVESMEYVEDYFAGYLMDTLLARNEVYIYGTWLVPGVERVIKQLKSGAGTNQASISLGGWAMSELVEGAGEVEYSRFTDTDNEIDPGTGERDPACLRVVDFRLDQDNKLHMMIYFRSNDLWGGFPANLAGLQLLKEYVAQEIGAEDGKIIYSSKGLHLYDHAIDVAAQRLGISDVGTMDDFVSWIGQGDTKDTNTDPNCHSKSGRR